MRGARSASRLTEVQAHIAAKNIAAHIRGEAPKHGKEFADIPAICVMDAGNNGVIILADKMLPPRKHGLLIPGPQAHWMKLAFEKYLLWKAQHRYVQLPLSDTPLGMSTMSVMELDENTSADLVRRLRRIEGQVRGIIRMIEENRDCAEIVTQLAAASRALDRAGFRLLSSSLRQCLTATANGQAEPMTSDQLEKLFLSLA